MAQVLEPPSDPLEGRIIAGGRYRLEAFRGAEDLGRTYLGRQLALERPVTIRLLHGSHLSDEQLVTRFNRGGLAAARVRHPNVVDVVDLGREPTDGSLYLVSEHIDGRTLDAVVRDEGPLEPHRVRDIGVQVASALQAAHTAGVIHRGLEPRKVMVLDRESDDGELVEVVKVLDFGLAKIESPVGGAPGHATIEMVSGTPEYMSPEQCDGRDLDARSDLYACGCLLYFLATGRPPFVGDGLLEVLVKHSREAPVRPSKIARNVHSGLEAVILQLLEKRPDDRYKTARALRAALAALHVGRPGTSPGVEIDVDLGEETPTTDLDVKLPRDTAETPITTRAPVPERLKKTMIIPRDDRVSVPPGARSRGSATRVMAAAIAVAIVVGVVVGLFFGQMYTPTEAPAPVVEPSPEP
jgi:serine/threonine-protein kinase